MNIYWCNCIEETNGIIQLFHQHRCPRQLGFTAELRPLHKTWRNWDASPSCQVVPFGAYEPMNLELTVAPSDGIWTRAVSGYSTHWNFNTKNQTAKIYVGHLWCDPKKAMDSKLDPACRHPSVCCRSQDQDLKFTTKWNQKNARLIQEHRWDLFTRRSPDGQPLLLKVFANWKLCRSSPTSTSHSYLIAYVSIDQTEAKFRNPMLNWINAQQKNSACSPSFSLFAGPKSAPG